MGAHLMENLELYNRAKEVPGEAKRTIRGGRLNGKTDINPMWRIKKLTELFGPCGIGWYYEVVSKWLEKYSDEVACFVEINLYVKYDGEWSKPIYGSGGNMFAEKEKSGIHLSDECYKMATTDAISVACKQLGIGADVYLAEDTTKYTNDKEDKTESIPERLKDVYSELIRIGYTEKALMKTYKLDDITEISDLQIKDFLKKASALPDKGKK